MKPSEELKDDRISQIIKPCGFKGGLYLGNHQASTDQGLLQKLKITAVLTAACELSTPQPPTITHLQLPLQDTTTADLLSLLPQSLAFIDNNLKQGNVLVHCRLGVSRSASIVIAYLMSYQKLPLQVAYDRVKKKRFIVNPNSGLKAQLQKLEKML